MIKKHCYLKELKPILSRSFVDKYGRRINSSQNEDGLCVDHISAPYGTFTEELINKILEYLKKKDDWVKQEDILKVAKKQDYSYSEITDSLKAIAKHTGNKYVNIGVRFEDNGEEYRWYDLPQEEVKTLEEQLNWFDQL